MNDEGFRAGWITAAILMATICAGVASAALGAIATPPDFVARKAALQQKIERAERLARSPGDPQAYGPYAVCPSLDSSALETAKQALTSGGGNLSFSNVALTPMPASRADDALAAVRVIVEVDGAYDAVLAWLDRLDEGRPEVFADNVELSSRTSSVHLKLTGKVFCWTVARR